MILAIHLLIKKDIGHPFFSYKKDEVPKVLREES
jgi:hypothetical protein